MGRLKDLPPELIVGWVLWMLGGVALMVWFRRRAAPRQEPRFTAVAEPPRPPHQERAAPSQDPSTRDQSRGR